ncbi:hypothetical protein ACHAW6_005194, partial [Cyclotella cf. meneghiniana]
VTSAYTTQLIQDLVGTLHPKLGFLPADFLVHYLHASGATALLIGQVDTDIIHLIARWCSYEMLCYLHVQAAPLMHDYSHKMLLSGNYSLIPNQSVPMN